MSNLHVHNLLESLNEELQQNKEEKKVLEMLEKQLLEKQQRERILEQLALKNTEAAKEATQDLATVHQTTRTTLKDPESIHRTIEKRYQEQVIKKLTESIEASITKKLNNRSRKDPSKKTNTLTKQQPLQQQQQPLQRQQQQPIQQQQQQPLQQQPNKQTEAFKNQLHKSRTTQKKTTIQKNSPFSHNQQPTLLSPSIAIPTSNLEYDGTDTQAHKNAVEQLKHKLKNKKLTPKILVQHYVANVFGLNHTQTDTHNSRNSDTTNLQALDKSAMLALGASESDLNSLTQLSGLIIQKSIRNTMKKNLKQLVVQSLLSAINQTTISDGLGAKAIESSYVSIINSLKSSRKLGHSDTIDELHQTILTEAKDEVCDMLQTIVRHNHSGSDANNSSDQSHDSNELNHDLILKKAKEMGVLSNASETIIENGSQRLKTNNDIQDSVTIDLFDLGHMLLEFENSDSNNESDDPYPYRYTEDDEHNIILDRIRANLMQMAVSGSFVSGLLAKFKLMIHKRAGMKLGIYNQEIEERLSSEAKQRATTHLHAMLDEALLERASFHSEFGTDWENNATKIKSVIRNLNRLGVSVDTDKLSERIAHANRAMWPVIELEIASIHTLLAESDFPLHVQQALTERLAQIKRVQKRIESVEPISVPTTIPADRYRSICTNV